eukprot:14322971-Alexandrium_andersonii.AAC.1
MQDLRRPKTAARLSSHGPPLSAREPPAGLAGAPCVRPLLGGRPVPPLCCPSAAGLPAPRPLAYGPLASSARRRTPSPLHVGRPCPRGYGGRGR